MTIKFDTILSELRESDVSGITDITYADLVIAISGSTLTEGLCYCITDFATVHWMTDADGEFILDGEEKIIHTGETEPLVVFATSSNTLAQEAYSPSHPEDIIRYDWDNSNWQGILAFYDNGTSETVPGWKGVIYRREDNLTGNRCNFDFREITYRVWNIEQEAWDELTEYTAGNFVQVGTVIYWALDTSTDIEPGVDEGWEDYWKVVIDLSDGDGGTHSYFVLYQTGWYSAIIDDVIPILDIEDYIDRTMFIDDSGGNVFEEFYLNLPYTIFGESCRYNTFGIYCGLNTFGTSCEGNTFGTACYDNTFGTSCEGNTFGEECYGNTFGADCRYNTFGTACYDNTFGAGCYSNTFGTECNNNTFGTYCYVNTFGTGCYVNTFGKYCYSNTFGTYCIENTFGTSCVDNTFGTYCDSNTFGTYCIENTFGIGCYGNTFGTSCGYNTFGTYCCSNTFGASCDNNTFGTYCYGNTFGANCEDNTFGANCEDNTFPELARYNEFKNCVSELDCSAFTAVYDTNVTHQIGTSGTIYQTYIDESGTPTMVISTEKIGIYSD